MVLGGAAALALRIHRLSNVVATYVLWLHLCYLKAITAGFTLPCGHAGHILANLLGRVPGAPARVEGDLIPR